MNLLDWFSRRENVPAFMPRVHPSLEVIPLPEDPQMHAVCPSCHTPIRYVLLRAK
jgi:hypothetical protein